MWTGRRGFRAGVCGRFSGGRVGWPSGRNVRSGLAVGEQARGRLAQGRPVGAITVRAAGVRRGCSAVRAEGVRAGSARPGRRESPPGAGAPRGEAGSGPMRHLKPKGVAGLSTRSAARGPVGRGGSARRAQVWGAVSAPGPVVAGPGVRGRASRGPCPGPGLPRCVTRPRRGLGPPRCRAVPWRGPPRAAWVRPVSLPGWPRPGSGPATGRSVGSPGRVQGGPPPREVARPGHEGLAQPARGPWRVSCGWTGCRRRKRCRRPGGRRTGRGWGRRCGRPRGPGCGRWRRSGRPATAGR